MKIKRLLSTIVAAGALTAFAGGVSQNIGASQVYASINSEAKKTKYSGTKYLDQLLKAAGLVYNQFNSVANGKKYGSRFGYRNGVGKPEGIVVHETADPGASAWDEGRYFNNNWTSAYTYVHAVVDQKQVIQLMTPDYGVWGAGAIANKRFIQIELCEVSTRKQFVQSVANDAYYIASLLHAYNLTPSRASSNGTGTIWSHADVSNYLGGTDHGDPIGYFAKWGYSMNDFYSLIVYYYNKMGTSTNAAAKASSSSSSSSSSSKASSKSASSSSSSSSSSASQKSASSKSSSSSSNKPASQAATVKTMKVMRNAYTYTAAGKRNAKIKTIKATSYLKIYGGIVTIKKAKYYKYGNNKYVRAGNITGYGRKLKHNAWVYTRTGARDQTMPKQLKGRKLTTYGSQVKIKANKKTKVYYLIGYTSSNAPQYVKAVNFK